MATAEEDALKRKIQAQFSRYPLRTYPKGQILVFADESPDHIFYVVKGRIRKYDVSYKGEEVVVNTFKPGAFFPMSWAINRTPNSYLYKTEEPAELHIVPVEDALEFLKSNPDVMLDLLSRIYKGMDGVLGRLVHLMSGTAKSRLIYELIIECRRFGRKDDEGRCVLSISETDLAAQSGLARETISREIKNLNGIVGIKRGAIVVSDMAALERLLGGVI